MVGDTGAGKSSLMNALVEHDSILPTSGEHSSTLRQLTRAQGMRACTAVVVEISANTESASFEADVEFLSRAEVLSYWTQTRSHIVVGSRVKGPARRPVQRRG